MEPGQTSVKRSDILTAFEGFREELDDHNDRRERIIKTNRDITNFSKKLIFQLHRITQDENTTEGRAKAIAKLQNKFAEVQALYAKLQPDLVGEWGRKYARSVSGGLQELIEALSLRHYLLHNAMISSTEVQNFVTSDSGTRYLELSNADYLLGISDLTGELMRLAISTITRPGGRDRALHIAQFVRKCVADFESFTPHIRDLVKKQHETNASLRKIEDALYAVRVREYEHHGEGTFDDVISHFTYSFERPQQPLDIEIDTFTIGPGGKSYHVTAELDQKLTLNYDWLEMSDDEYFDDDDIFNSAELDTIPSLNESSENSVAVVPQNEIPRSTTAPAQPSGSRRPPQTPGRTPSGSTRLSTIMNALRASAQGALSSQV
ncbi:hypothetical protein FRC07_011092 [Ceratobasidium sp. 392]|nr:hypothetical protein FRC07_011092 [Ceratobasidium sp. 392]